MLISCVSPCSRANLFIGLISFTDAESDSLILRRFIKAKDFTELKDTFLLSRATGNFQRQHDTILVFQFLEGSDGITSSYDYELLIPKTNAVFKISDISEDIMYNHSGTRKLGCINPVTSYGLNGQLISNDNYNEIIYIKK